MAPQFTTIRRIEFAETDMAGIVHFANFYHYMEQAEHAYFRSLGLSIMQKQADGATIGWPRVAASCSFEAPAFFEDILEVKLFIREKKARSLRIEVEFWKEQMRIAHGEMTTVCCLCRPGEPLQSIDIPAAYLDKIRVASASSDSESAQP